MDSNDERRRSVQKLIAAYSEAEAGDVLEMGDAAGRGLPFFFYDTATAQKNKPRIPASSGLRALMSGFLDAVSDLGAYDVVQELASAVVDMEEDHKMALLRLGELADQLNVEIMRQRAALGLRGR